MLPPKFEFDDKDKLDSLVSMHDDTNTNVHRAMTADFLAREDAKKIRSGLRNKAVATAVNYAIGSFLTALGGGFMYLLYAIINIVKAKL